jgi:RNA polymerase sigma-70 factor (ECF subfamily)
MIRFEGMKYREVAEALGISVKTVENQMGSAIQFLKEELREFLPVIILLFSILISDQIGVS